MTATTASGSLQQLAAHLVEAVAPLDQVFRDLTAFRALMLRLGWEVDALPASYAAAANAAHGAVEALGALGDVADLAAVLEVIEEVGATYRAIAALSNTPPAGVDAAQFKAEFTGQLFEHLLADYLSSELPAVFSALEAIGVIAFEDSPASTTRRGFVRTRFAWEEIPKTLADLDAIPAKVCGWGAAGFDFSWLVEIVSEWAEALGFPASLDRVADAFSSAIADQATATPAYPIASGVTISLFDIPVQGTTQEVALSLTELPAEGSALPGLLLRPLIPAGVPNDAALGDGLSFGVRAGSDLADEFSIVLRPGELAVRYPFAPNKRFPAAGFGASLAIGDGTPFLLFGDIGGIRIEVSRATFGLDVDQRDGELDLTFRVEPEGLTLVLSAASLDTFIGSILGEAVARIEFPLALRWSNRGGFSFVAGDGFATSIPLDLTVGTIAVERVDFGLDFTTADPAQLTLRATGTFSGAVGPIVFAIDGLGIELPIVFEDGNAGPFDIRFGVAWPTALGLGVDAEGVVTGGGFLNIDVPAGRYSGVAALQMLGVGLTALGIIETKLAASPGGWSFFLSVIADFTPLPLGFGFTLNGVGGFMGLHRTFDKIELAEGVRQGGLDSLLFPEDPIADAVQILEDIEAYFPTAVDHHAFGAMAKIAWGAPTIVTAELGVILAVPDFEIAVVGEMASVLPKPDAALLELHMGVVGFVDVTEGTFWVAASIYDSTLVGLALSGDMAMYLSTLSQPYFLLSVGGFNPGWAPPASVPSSLRTLRRMSVAVDLGDALQISLTSYFAITANTLQFGAALYAEAQTRAIGIDFSAEGWFDFDVLLIVTPFSIVAGMSAGVTIRALGETLTSIQLTLHVDGPKPWTGTAYAEFEFLKQEVPFRIEIGGDTVDERPATIELWPELSAALEDPASWVAPDGSATLPDITLRPLDTTIETGLWLRPDSAIEIRQRVVPLSREIEAYGELVPVGVTRFDVEAAGLNTGVATPFSPTEDWFAPAQFTQMTSSERLGAPSFELMDAGASLAAEDYATTANPADVAAADVEYEEAVWEDDSRSATTVVVLPSDRLSAGFFRRSVKTRRSLSTRRKVDVPRLTIAPARYTVVEALVPSKAKAVNASAIGPERSGGYAFADVVGARRARTAGISGASGRFRVVPVHAARLSANLPSQDSADVERARAASDGART
jgi:hypothetical protein